MSKTQKNVACGHLMAHDIGRTQFQTVNDYIEAIRNWILCKLPRVNLTLDSISNHEQKIIDLSHSLIKYLQLKVTTLIDHFPLNEISKIEARNLLQLFGMLQCSIEHHTICAGLESGTLTSRIPNLEETLISLAEIAQHPPCATYYTYWLMNNTPEYLTFTGDQQEVFFNQQVNLTYCNLSKIAFLLRPISIGTLAIHSAESIINLEAATLLQLEIWNSWRTFYHADKNGRRNMEPEFFARVFRTYLPKYPVGSKIWSGVNAAHLPQQMSVDFLIGTTNNWYKIIAEERLQFMPVEHQDELKSDMAQKSVGMQLLNALGLSYDMIKNQTNDDVIDIFKRLTGKWNVNQIAALQKFSDLYIAAKHTTSYHWFLIREYLIKESQKMSKEDLNKLAVKPDKGTGGMHHEETKSIHDMRAKHEVFSKIVFAATHLFNGNKK